MENIGVIIFVIFITMICIVLVLKFKRSKDLLATTTDNYNGEKSETESIRESLENELVIKMEMLPAEEILAENKLVEITDSKVLAHVNNLVPGLAQVGNVGHNAVQGAQSNGETLYRAIIPAGVELSKSNDMENAVRGFYPGSNGKGIGGHANLLAVDVQTETMVVANTVAAAMGVASMVVGQYYMKQINAELGVISEGISKISDFQDNEYRSRVFSLISHVKKISDFQVEILENDELRLSKIAQLDNLEEESTQLLGQANLSLDGYTKKKNLDYKAYEEDLKEIEKWYMYQESLIGVLYKISELRYAIHLGSVSRDQCVALLPTYTKQVIDTKEKLTDWHKDNANRLKIDTEEGRRIRNGFDGAVHLIPSIFKNELKYREISQDTVNMIESQSNIHKGIGSCDTSDLYAEDVQLISRNGKIYYLPGSKVESL